MRFDGKVAVVAGAAAGFGLAVSTRRAAEGAKVVLVDRAAEALGVAAASIDGSLPVLADLSHESDVDTYVERALEEHGRIDLFFNNAGIKGGATFAPYVASKHAVVGLTRCAALEGAPFGIRVNGIAPGHIDTRMARDLTAQTDPADPQGVFERTAARVPLGRYGTAEEVANLAVWLLSDEASYLSGATHLIDGALNA